MNYTENINLVEVKSQLDKILQTLETIKEEKVEKVYTIEKLCEYLGVGKSVIETYRRNGELPYSKIGRTFLYSQRDIDQLLKNTRPHYC